jgi:hypothetical protein
VIGGDLKGALEAQSAILGGFYERGLNRVAVVLAAAKDRGTALGQGLRAIAARASGARRPAPITAAARGVERADDQKPHLSFHIVLLQREKTLQGAHAVDKRAGEGIRVVPSLLVSASLVPCSRPA